MIIILALFGISFIIGGIIGFMIIRRKRANVIANSHANRLHPYTASNGERYYTTFSILLDD